ncbi:hypothetical protein A3A71_03745 [Candidatus Berkelbacteria bacterium RIFCSPLOWO2_01_FULL_50_28]|uniref:Plasmid stabilization protein n=1 Tax=Candidatus Berkelbacteria bacterium RIFCSPLOWO2_01_FULL_50_28 TaxID=1797471 RepID=A0A1F5EA40_9BACT|nr:MAG: hypothetical protein A3F39_01110 [Candidatus Berkelbacteria bacterium RIFCSPHIGHO2_12_FULL_50_11]OGD64262.1 MAG: hypothetical protein A3A71_03745 [Candidatus Berkelbacteria bacterium RIFCSPLOWO2_01_FULL_50_28]
MPELFYKPGALRVVKKFTAVEITEYKNVLAEIKQFPDGGKFLKGSLKGLRKWKYKVRSIPYRIVYLFENNTITIIAVGKRKDFYELLK